MARVLIVELNARGRVAAVFRSEGLEVETVGHVEEIGAVITALVPDLVVLEVRAVGPDAVRLCEAFDAACAVPIVIISEVDDEIDVLAGYGAGAASVVAATMGPRELVARTRALLRRGSTLDHRPSDVVIVGPVVLDRECRQLTVSGKLVPLPRREFDIAEALMRRAGTVVTRRQLLVELWGGTMRESKTLDVQVGRLRSRLAAAEGKRRIVTVRGVGYRFDTDEDIARGSLVGFDASGIGC